MKLKKRFLAAMMMSSLFASAFFNTTHAHNSELIVLKDQGSFAIGGKVIQHKGKFDPIKQGVFYNKDETGQSLHGDHAYVFYQVPDKARKYPLVFWHGNGQSAQTWQTTPDGRDGFQNIFLRKQYSVYLIDQPRRGRAGRSTVGGDLTPNADEQSRYGTFRLGVWPDFYPNVQFSKDPKALEQFFRQMVPNTGPFDAESSIDAASKLFNKIGDGILVTHSMSGGLGWQTALRNQHVKGIVSLEPAGNFPFPKGDEPEPYSLAGRKMNQVVISKEAFKQLIQKPILLIYGDNIPDKPTNIPGEEQFRVFFGQAKKWNDVAQKYGGKVQLLHLPEIGIYGNTHFPMSDLNNQDIADLINQFLHEQELD
ncbi:MAG: alpha/beta hydrolase [Vibrio sp.]